MCLPSSTKCEQHGPAAQGRPSWLQKCTQAPLQNRALIEYSSSSSLSVLSISDSKSAKLNSVKINSVAREVALSSDWVPNKIQVGRSTAGSDKTVGGARAPSGGVAVGNARPLSGRSVVAFVADAAKSGGVWRTLPLPWSLREEPICQKRTRPTLNLRRQVGGAGRASWRALPPSWSWREDSVIRKAPRWRVGDGSITFDRLGMYFSPLPKLLQRQTNCRCLQQHGAIRFEHCKSPYNMHVRWYI